jgi:biotin-(acetyl-CoA carboxylase) ligase
MKIFFLSFNKYYNEWKQYGFSGIRKEWLKNAYNIGKSIIVKDVEGNETNKGIFIDVDTEGNILLKNDNKIEKIFSGDVF